MFSGVRIVGSHEVRVDPSAPAARQCGQLGPPELGAPPGSAILSTDCTPRGFRAMPIATPEVYAQMLDRAKEHGFAYPAINVTSSQTLNAALRGFADAESDGIVQVSTGGAEYLSGAGVKDMVTGASALASF